MSDFDFAREARSFADANCSVSRELMAERLTALLRRSADAERESRAKECDGWAWSAGQGARDALSGDSRMFQLGEERAYARVAIALRSAPKVSS